MKRMITTTFLSALSFSTFAFAQSMAPGMWKTESQFHVNSIPLPKSQDEACVSSADAKDAKATIEKELKKNGCELQKWDVKNSKLKAELSCKNKDVEAKGEIHGTFSEKSYTLEGNAKGTYQNMIPSAATLKLVGQWVQDCPKEVKSKSFVTVPL